MEIRLRPYQETAINLLWDALAQDRNVLLQAIMGAGKTIIVCELIKRLLKMHPKGRVLFLAHRAELITQARDRLLKVWPEAPAIGLACASVDKDVILEASITIGSPQTLARRLNEISVFHLLIVDESHKLSPQNDRKSQYNQLIERLRLNNPEMRLLGITATPYRLGHGFIYGDECKKGHVNIFETLHHQITAKELTEQEYLVPLKGKVSVESQLIEDLKGVNKSKGDFAEGELSEVMSKSVHIQNVVDCYEKYAGDRKYTMVFAVSIAHAEEVAKAISEKGHDVEVVHSKISLKKRRRILNDFVTGRIRILVNVAVLIEGFDAPLTDCIVHARPTLSSALFLQTVGRGLRIAEGKKDCLLIDLVGNVERFGTDLDNVKVKVPGTSDQHVGPPIKICPECDSAVHAAVRKCPECEYEFPKEDAIDPEMDSRMKDVTFNASPPIIESSIQEVLLDHYTSQKGNDILKLDVYCDDLMYPVSHYWNFDDTGHPYF